MAADFDYANPPVDWFGAPARELRRPAGRRRTYTEAEGERVAEERAGAWRYARDDHAPQRWEP